MPCPACSRQEWTTCGLCAALQWDESKVLTLRIPTFDSIVRNDNNPVIIEPRCEKTGRGGGGPTKCDTNRSVQSQKQARGLKY